jgi:hypothetical protein
VSTGSPADAGYRKSQYALGLEPAKGFLHRPQIKIHLLKHLKKHGAFLIREGSERSIYQKEQLRSHQPHNEASDGVSDKEKTKIWRPLQNPFALVPMSSKWLCKKGLIMKVDMHPRVWYLYIILQRGYIKYAYSEGSYYYSKRIGNDDR